MLNNPRTTILGYVAIAVILIYVAYGFYIGKPMDLQTILTLIGGGAVGGGLISAADGGH